MCKLGGLWTVSCVADGDVYCMSIACYINVVLILPYKNIEYICVRVLIKSKNWHNRCVNCDSFLCRSAAYSTSSSSTSTSRGVSHSSRPHRRWSSGSCWNSARPNATHSMRPHSRWTAAAVAAHSACVVFVLVGGRLKRNV